jgi:hypothetical protein
MESLYRKLYGITIILLYKVLSILQLEIKKNDIFFIFNDKLKMDINSGKFCLSESVNASSEADINTNSSVKRCTAILRYGKRIGENCNVKIKIQDIDKCKRHTQSSTSIASSSFSDDTNESKQSSDLLQSQDKSNVYWWIFGFGDYTDEKPIVGRVYDRSSEIIKSYFRKENPLRCGIRLYEKGDDLFRKQPWYIYSAFCIFYKVTPLIVIINGKAQKIKIDSVASLLDIFGTQTPSFDDKEYHNDLTLDNDGKLHSYSKCKCLYPSIIRTKLSNPNKYSYRWHIHGEPRHIHNIFPSVYYSDGTLVWYLYPESNMPVGFELSREGEYNFCPYINNNISSTISAVLIIKGWKEFIKKHNIKIVKNMGLDVWLDLCRKMNDES